MSDELDDLIREIQETSDLSAARRNELHACLSTHPWAKGKDIKQRAMDAHFALIGSNVSANLHYRIRRMA